jgi:hypothetical protein
VDRHDRLVAIHVRHEDIGDHEVDAPLTQYLERSTPVARHDDVIAGKLEKLPGRVAHQMVIVDDENRSHRVVVPQILQAVRPVGR